LQAATPPPPEVEEGDIYEDEFEEDMMSPTAATSAQCVDRSNLKSAGASSVATRATSATSAKQAPGSDIDEVDEEEDFVYDDEVPSPLAGGTAIPPGTSRLVAVDGRSYDYAEDPEDDFEETDDDDLGGYVQEDNDLDGYDSAFEDE
jgi:hypothetical protein